MPQPEWKNTHGLVKKNLVGFQHNIGLFVCNKANATGGCQIEQYLWLRRKALFAMLILLSGTRAQADKADVRSRRRDGISAASI